MFQLSHGKPDVIITSDTKEAIEASKKYPDIKFVAPDLSFPNYAYTLPVALLDEMSVLNKTTGIKIPACDIAYFNNGHNEHIHFINQLRCLGNTKIMGPGYCVDELDRFFPQRMTPYFYSHAKVVATTSIEEALKGLFMGKACIIQGEFPKCYPLSKTITTDIFPHAEQVSLAWDFSHTIILSEILTLIGEHELSDALKGVINFTKENHEKTNTKN